MCRLISESRLQMFKGLHCICLLDEQEWEKLQQEPRNIIIVIINHELRERSWVAEKERKS